MKKFIMIFSALIMSFMVNAQDANKFGPYETNSFFSNWFVEAGAGVNVPFDHGFTFDFGGLAAYGNVGKWFVPCYGVRVGWLGLTTGNLDEPTTFRDSFTDGPYFNYVHGDLLLNASNLIGGYKNRAVEFVPYLTVGALFNNTARAIGVGAGLQIPVRLGKRVSIVPQVQGVVTNNRVYGGEGVTALATGTLGVRVNLGKTGWVRSASVYAAYEAQLAERDVKNRELVSANETLTKEYDVLKAENVKLHEDIDELNELLKNAASENESVCSSDKFVAYFALGKHKLSAGEEEHLRDFVEKVLSENDGCTIAFHVGGATDSKTGTEKHNAQLRDRRANYVVNLLRTKYGVENVKPVDGLIDIDIPELSRAAVITVIR